MGLTAAGAIQNFRVGVEALCRKARAHSPTCRLAVSPLTVIAPEPSAKGNAGVTELSWDYAFIYGDKEVIPPGWRLYGPWPVSPLESQACRKD